MGNKVCVLFPGLGNQSVGMGKDFYDNSEKVRKMYETIFDISGVDVSEISFHGTDARQRKPRNCQLITLARSCAAYMSIDDKTKDRIKWFAGHSFGEVVALWAAGFFGEGEAGFRNLVGIVSERGRIMGEYSFKDSCLVNVRGPSRKEIKEFCDSRPGLDVALYNNDTNHVIGGVPKIIDRYWDEIPKKKRKLLANGPFHTIHYAEAAKELSKYLREFNFGERKPKGIVYPNYDDEPYSIETLPVKMGAQLCNPVYWDRIISKIPASTTFIETGPKRSLTGILNGISKNLNCIPIQTVGDIGRIEEGL